MTDAITLILSAPAAGPVLGLLAAIIIVLLATLLAACLSGINGDAGGDHPSADQLWDCDHVFDLIDHDRPATHRSPRS